MQFKRISIVLMLVSCLCLIAPVAEAAEEQETGEAFSFKISAERQLESKLNTVLREVTGIKRLIALVNVEVEALHRPPEDTRVNKDNINVLFLPGVPARTGETYFAEGAAKPRIVIKKLNVRVLVDSNVSKQLTSLAHNVAISLVGYNPDRGDTLVVEEFDFMSGGTGIWDLMRPPQLYYLLLAVPAVVFLVAASMFFLNPYRLLRASLNNINSVTQKSATDSAGQSGSVPSAPLPVAPEAMGQTEPVETDSGMTRPFGFLKGRRTSELLFALKDMPAEDISIALNYMEPATAAEILALIDESVRSSCIDKLIAPGQLDPGRVRALEESIKDRLTFMSGGDDKLAGILENTEDLLRDSLMDTIEHSDADAASRIRRRVRTFESVVRGARAASIDTLVRRFAPAAFARILTSTPGDVQGKVLDSLGKGASELMREELRFARALPPARLRNEKRRVVEEFLAISEAGLIDEQPTEES